MYNRVCRIDCVGDNRVCVGGVNTQACSRMNDDFRTYVLLHLGRYVEAVTENAQVAFDAALVDAGVKEFSATSAGIDEIHIAPAIVRRAWVMEICLDCR